MASIHSFAPGELIGNYEIVQKIGGNAFGEVYIVKHQLLRQTQVIRTVFTEAAFPNPELRERFFQNFAGAMAVRHPNLVEIFNIFQDDASKMCCIVVEYVKNGTLLEYLTQNPEFNTISFVVNVAEKVSAALSAAARNGLVHGNINPSNIMLSDSGEIKLADLGTLLPRESGARARSRFTALEVFDGHEDIRSDIYSLGMSLYLLAAGRFPYHSGEFFHRIATEGLPEPIAVSPTVPPALNNLIVRLTAKDPADRPQNVEELQNLIAELKQELIAPAKPALPKIALSIPSVKITKNVPPAWKSAPPPKPFFPSVDGAGEKTSSLRAMPESAGEHNLPPAGEFSAGVPDVSALPQAPASTDLPPPKDDEFVINEVVMRRQPQKEFFSWTQLPWLLYSFAKSLIAAAPEAFKALKGEIVCSAVFCGIIIGGSDYVAEHVQKIWNRENSASIAGLKLMGKTTPKEKEHLTRLLAREGDWDSLTQSGNPKVAAACLNSLTNENDPDGWVIAATAMMMQIDGRHEEKDFLPLLEKAAEAGSPEAIFFLRSWYESGNDEAQMKKYQQMCSEYIQKGKGDQ